MPTPWAMGRSPSPFSQRRSASLTWTTDTSRNAMGPPRQRLERPSRMSFRPALVDPQGWSHDWQRGWSHVTGKTSGDWSHVTGKRHWITAHASIIAASTAALARQNVLPREITASGESRRPQQVEPGVRLRIVYHDSPISPLPSKAVSAAWRRSGSDPPRHESGLRRRYELGLVTVGLTPVRSWRLCRHSRGPISSSSGCYRALTVTPPHCSGSTSRRV